MDFLQNIDVAPKGSFNNCYIEGRKPDLCETCKQPNDTLIIFLTADHSHVAFCPSCLRGAVAALTEQGVI